MNITENLKNIHRHLPAQVRLVCVSKFHPCEAIEEAYRAGERDFGESRAQELMQKAPQLPDDIRWHFIGPLQSNKVKYVVPIAYMIHSVENERLLREIDKCAAKNNRIVNVLLEVHIAQESNKHGFSTEELLDFFAQQSWQHYPSVHICGLMGIATLTDSKECIRAEFHHLSELFTRVQQTFTQPYFTERSIGMSDDYEVAITEGSTMVRIGTSIFGERLYP